MADKPITTMKARLQEALDLRGMRPIDLANASGVSKGSISQYLAGRNQATNDRLYSMAKVLRVNPVWLMGFDVPRDDIHIFYPGLEPAPKTHSVPILGTIACGKPITSEENIQGFADVPEHIKCDFCLRCKGDSMIGARIYDGDIVYVKSQPEVENGQIAAVLVDGDVTLKRLYAFSDHLILRAENPAYPDLIYDDRNDVHILGRAFAFTGKVK